jgi:hypothetical protein
MSNRTLIFAADIILIGSQASWGLIFSMHQVLQGSPCTMCSQDVQVVDVGKIKSPLVGLLHTFIGDIA